MQTAKCIQTKLIMRIALKVKIYRNKCIGEFIKKKVPEEKIAYEHP